MRAPPGATTRPTAERLRQALFDIIMHAPWGGRLDGLAVLDAFAGTGALGLEALSRGAASAVFMELDRAALAALHANVAACRGAAARIVAADVLRPPRGEPCDLVFLDPPYRDDILPKALGALTAGGWIAATAVVVAESASDQPPRLGELLAERSHGAGLVTFWRPHGGRDPT